MKLDQLYIELKLLADKLGIEISEQNFRHTGVAVKSGYCKVKGRDLFLIDKHIKPAKKAESLAEFLAQLPMDAVSIEPVVKEYLDQFRGLPIKKTAKPEIQK